MKIDGFLGFVLALGLADEMLGEHCLSFKTVRKKTQTKTGCVCRGERALFPWEIQRLFSTGRLSTDVSEVLQSVCAAAGDGSSSPSILPGPRLFILCLPKLPLLLLIASYVGRGKCRELFPCWRCLMSEVGYFSASFVYHSGES